MRLQANFRKLLNQMEKLVVTEKLQSEVAVDYSYWQKFETGVKWFPCASS